MFGATITTDRMTLRPVDERDNALLVRWRNSPGVRPGIYIQPRADEESQARWFRRYASSPDEIRWMIEYGGKPVACCGFADKRPMEGTANLAVLIGEPDARGRGLATEAVSAILDYGFEQWGLRRVTAEVFARNEPARRLYHNLGFVDEGRMRAAHYDWETGKPDDVLIMGLLREEWTAR